MPFAKMPILPRPGEMIGHLDKSVRGQEKAKRDIANAVYNHYVSQAERDRDGTDMGRQHILLLGPTGSGKTFIVKTLADYLGFPVSFASATALVEVGYRGRPVDDINKSLLDRADGNPRLAERGIIFIDEIDKIRRQDVGGMRDVSGEGVQNALLTMLDGRIADNVDSNRHEPIDTSRSLFVCTGAFVGLQEIVERRLGASGAPTIGFPTRAYENLTGVPNQPIYSALCQATTPDFVEFGMIPEFIGRFATITALHELSRADMRAIIGEATQGSALSRQQRFARLHGIDLEITDDALDEIVDDAFRMGTGARGLHRLVNVAVDSVDYRWGELADDGVTKVVIDRACLLGKADPKLVRGKATHQRLDEQLRRDCITTLPNTPTSVRPRAAGSLPSGITDTTGWTPSCVRKALEQVKTESIDWKEATASAKKWWAEFERSNESQLQLVLRTAEELKIRKATINEFFLAYIYSNCDNILANLHYLDYRKLKEEEDRKKRTDAEGKKRKPRRGDKAPGTEEPSSDDDIPF
ncbi:MAG: AAA family ATPase [Planctomycetota bacterium]